MFTFIFSFKQVGGGEVEVHNSTVIVSVIEKFDFFSTSNSFFGDQILRYSDASVMKYFRTLHQDVLFQHFIHVHGKDFFLVGR